MNGKALILGMMLAGFWLPAQGSSDQTPIAFPGAEGFGAHAQGGRGGDVYHVTNLNDSGPGSLRNGLEIMAGPRTIVFDVSGTIDLESRLRIVHPYLTLAGQTAPGDGITLARYPLDVAASHVVVRYIRARVGDEVVQRTDAVHIESGSNIIIDHVSASWAIDEVRNGTATYGNGVIDSQDEVGGFPRLRSLPAPRDTDRDGMPDAWEMANGLDPQAASDRNGTNLSGTFYTNIEVYLNGLVANNGSSATGSY